MDDYIQEGTKREKVWTEAVAIGSAEFVEGIKEKLGVKAKNRRLHNKTVDGAYALKKATVPYNAHFDGKKVNLRG